MLFWIVAALLTLGASLAVLLPLARGNAAVDAGRNEIAVYRDQLDELERDQKRGLLARDEVEQARAEIGRRIIKADATTRDQDRAAGLAGAVRYLAAAAIISVPVVSWGLYAVLGSPDLPSQPLSARLSDDTANGSIEELVARAESQLVRNPDDLRGWEILGPIYFRMNRFGDAVTAYQNAIRIGGATAARQCGLGEAMVFAAEGLITADAKAVFEAALRTEPGYPKARFFLAMAKGQEGKRDDAIADWKALVAELPADEPWRVAAEQMIAATSQAQASPPSEGSQPSAAGNDGQAAQAEQAKMIAEMVAGLDRRLRDSPNDPEGWQRLVRSYVVLGKPAEARDALMRAVAALGADSPAGTEIVRLAASLGVKVE